MSWIHRFNRMLARGTAAQPEPAKQEAPPAAQPPGPRPVAAKAADTNGSAKKRVVSPRLAARAAAIKAVAEAMRKATDQAEAAANARAVLAKMGVKIPAPAPAAPLLSGQRKALIAEAMGHWARGHEIYERLDPGLKERVRQLAERMAPK